MPGARFIHFGYFSIAMTHQQVAFRRKVIYLSIMALLLLPLSYLGLPAQSRASRDEPSGSYWEVLQRGRVLSNLRYQHKLAQGNLGDIDPGSETMKFAMFGLRGIAATLLWNKAHEHKKKKNWTALKQVLNDIARLQPNFVNVWRFQGWNLSFNVSVESDNYRYRYYWVLQGIHYLKEGQKYNDRDTRLLWDEAWFTGYKIGRSDEYIQFRKMFRHCEWFADPDKPNEKGFRLPGEYEDLYRNQDDGSGDRERPDNWLCAKTGFRRALVLHENKNAPLLGHLDELWYAASPKCQIRFCEVGVEEQQKYLVNLDKKELDEFITKQNNLKDFSVQQWGKALREWNNLGEWRFDSNAVQGTVSVRLGHLEEHARNAKRSLRQIDEIARSSKRYAKIYERLEKQKRTAYPRTIAG